MCPFLHIFLFASPRLSSAILCPLSYSLLSWCKGRWRCYNQRTKCVINNFSWSLWGQGMMCPPFLICFCPHLSTIVKLVLPHRVLGSLYLFDDVVAALPSEVHFWIVEVATFYRPSLKYFLRMKYNLWSRFISHSIIAPCLIFFNLYPDISCVFVIGIHNLTGFFQLFVCCLYIVRAKSSSKVTCLQRVTKKTRNQSM